MSKKNKQAKVELDADVKPVENAPEEVVVVAEPKVDFESWYALRKDSIPAIHKKEIIKADFKGRKVPMQSSIAEFDLALKKYGVKLA